MQVVRFSLGSRGPFLVKSAIRRGLSLIALLPAQGAQAVSEHSRDVLASLRRENGYLDFSKAAILHHANSKDHFSPSLLLSEVIYL